MATHSHNQELAERIKRGPSYLFIGQSWMKKSTGHDLFLSQAQKKFGGQDEWQSGYKNLLKSSANLNPRESIAWLHDRCNFIPLPEQIETISDFAWNGVATSAIDEVLTRALRRPWREVQRITTKSYQPTDPRSRVKLHLWSLFGNVGWNDSEGWPPLDQFQFVARKATATVLADSFPDLITPIGVLCIEGYEISTDWFSTEAFYQAFSTLNPGQVHLFSATEEHQKDSLLAALVIEEKVILHKEPLAHFLAEASEQGWLQLGQTPAEASFGQSIRVNGQSVSVPDSLFRQIQTTGRLITELAFAPLKPQTRDARYVEFRTFLYQSSYRPEWEAYLFPLQ